MSESNRLRELLAEARGWVFWAACEHGTASLGNGLVKRIDAALAEPVVKEPLTHLACKHCRVNVGIIAAFDTGTLAALMRAFDDHHAECVLDAKEKESK